MKKSGSVFWAVLAVIISAAFAWGQGSPAIVTQALTGYSKGATGVTLEYALQVTNREETPLTALSLSLVPHPLFVTDSATVTVDSLAPGSKTNLTVKVATSLLRDQTFFSRQPLLWAGRYTAPNGKVVEFPVKSKPGGAK